MDRQVSHKTRPSENQNECRYSAGISSGNLNNDMFLPASLCWATGTKPGVYYACLENEAHQMEG